MCAVKRHLRNKKEKEVLKTMSDKLKVGILGGTGMVGQRFISLHNSSRYASLG